MTIGAVSVPWITSGVALVSAAAIAIAPAEPPPPAVAHPVGDVQLTAFDPNNWTDVINAATANLTDIWNHWAPAPAPALTQALANQAGYLEDLLNGSKTITQVFDQMSANLTAAGDAAIDPFNPANPADFIYPSLDTTSSDISISALGLHLFDIPLPGKADLLDILTDGLSFTIGICPLCTDVTIPVLPLLIGDAAAAQVEPYLNFMGSPLSGVLWGEIGVTLGPILQFSNDITAISDALSGPAPDWNAAFQELIAMPANITNALLNGYGEVSATDLFSAFGITMPTMDANLTFDLGGLLSPAGSLINGIGFTDTLGDCDIACATFEVPTSAVGPIASMIGLAQAMAEAIGWDGDSFNSLLSMF